MWSRKIKIKLVYKIKYKKDKIFEAYVYKNVKIKLVFKN